MTQGAFIVIDGIDGSGKKTQLDLLKQRLEREKYQVTTADFPQYGQKSAGLVEEYLNGAYGTAAEIGPYAASILYAVDRFAASKKIRQQLAEGYNVISNRYVTANMGHQGSHITDSAERKKFFAWNNELEFGTFKIPQPDLNIILHVPAKIAQMLVDQKSARSYTDNKRDILEADLGHLERAEQTYIELTNTFPNFILIECSENGAILSLEAIHEKIWQAVLPKLHKAS